MKTRLREAHRGEEPGKDDGRNSSVTVPNGISKCLFLLEVGMSPKHSGNGHQIFQSILICPDPGELDDLAHVLFCLELDVASLCVASGGDKREQS